MVPVIGRDEVLKDWMMRNLIQLDCVSCDHVFVARHSVIFCPVCKKLPLKELEALSYKHFVQSDVELGWAVYRTYLGHGDPTP